jgi:hypothetical protein
MCSEGTGKRKDLTQRALRSERRGHREENPKSWLESQRYMEE